MTPAAADALHAAMMDYAEGREFYVQDLFAGADPHHRLKVRIITEYAWHALFSRQLLIRPEAAQLKNFTPEFTVIDLPGFKADPKLYGCASKTVIALDFTRPARPDRRHLLCGRDQEVDLHHPELPAAGEEGDPDALLRQ